MDKNTPDVKAGFLPDRVSVGTAVIPQIFAVLRHYFHYNFCATSSAPASPVSPSSSMEGSKLRACFHLPPPCTLNTYIYICKGKWCRGLCTSSSLYNTLPLHSKVCRMVCIQMKSISAAEHVSRDGGRRDHWCCLLGAALGDGFLWIWKLWEVTCWWQGPKEH